MFFQHFSYLIAWVVLQFMSTLACAQLLFFSENYPPYNFEDNQEIKGIAVDLLKEMHHQMGLPDPKIRIEPWARSYYNAQNIENAVVFSTTRTDEREQLFKWVGPIIDNEIVFLARKDRNIVVPDRYSLRNFRIAAVRLDIGEDVINRFQIHQHQTEIVTFPEQAARMLAFNRVDLWVYSLPPARYIQKVYGLNAEDFEVVFSYGSAGFLYYAFNLNVNDDVIIEYQQTLDSLVSDVGSEGETKYQQILKRYGAEIEDY
ncbi:substrate-binding periplasmic protein [Litoribrevibacter albus]|uniref:Amino acid ABC transporter substrate-binding protein n=1 Tax=Litoribrevibacter albus TaxID=1473156 RepID=A0AA37SAI4_9GAMM|nr:transporter substrate-binding domain-containing protein [Litoribrevibacter albus]GLQ32160.1 amino acid ABC transporter substrate-binding protein [Litoribrevibacter albus]